VEYDDMGLRRVISLGRPEYLTIEAAVAAAQQSGLDVVLPQEDPPTVQAVAWTDAEVAFSLDIGKALSLIATVNGVAAVLLDQPPIESHGERSVLLQFVGSESPSQPQVWNCGDLLLRLTRRKLNRVFVNPPDAFVYVQSAPTLIFSALWDEDQRAPMLYWSYTLGLTDT
jgi:hypothetical protein